MFSILVQENKNSLKKDVNDYLTDRKFWQKIIFNVSKIKYNCNYHYFFPYTIFQIYYLRNELHIIIIDFIDLLRKFVTLSDFRFLKSKKRISINHKIVLKYYENSSKQWTHMFLSEISIAQTTSLSLKLQLSVLQPSTTPFSNCTPLNRTMSSLIC